jgi:hypothetical protein
MANTDTWNVAFEAVPADTDDISGGADKIRDLKLAVRERMSKDHYFLIGGTDADHGEHNKVTLRVQSAKPTAEGSKGYLYAKDVDAKGELFYEDEDGDEIQLTAAGVLKETANPVKATNEDIDTGTDDAKFATALSLAGSKNVPHVVPSTAGKVMVSDGTDWTSAFKGVLQVVNYSSGAYFAGSVEIPIDNTIPQNTEGSEWATLAITPKSATSKLIIDVNLQVAVYMYGSMAVAALFQDLTADALSAASASRSWGGQGCTVIRMKHFMVSGTTSLTTFKVRVGNLTYVNGDTTTAARIFGGVNISSITITEIAL